MIWMSNGMPPTSGHSRKVRGCCQAPVPVDLSLLCTQRILPMTPHGPFSHSTDICQPFLYFSNLVMWLHAMKDTRLQETWNPYKKITSSTICQQFNYPEEWGREKYLRNQAWTSHMPTHVLLLLFSSFFLFWWAEFGSLSGICRHKKGLLAHCWFKVLVEQILSRELRAKSWPFCSLLSSANFFPGLSESIKELPECSHQSFNYSW